MANGTRLLCAVLLALGLAGAAPAAAATLQPIGSFQQPVYVTSAPGDPDQLLVVERAGTIEQVRDGAVSRLADLRPLVSTAGEGGQLSIAPAPDFAASGRLFAFYTGREQVPAEIHVAELRVSGGYAPLSSRRNLLTIPHPEDSNHYGGQLQFGPDGYLYISTGDGGGADDIHLNAQDPASPLGKILRIDPNPNGLGPYAVPPDNPFAADGLPAALVWSYGLRNPFRFSFDRLGGGLAIGDVGQDAREEIDYAPPPGRGAGANFGWSCFEGSLPNPASVDPRCGAASIADFTFPAFEYPHEGGGGGAFGRAVIGGYVVADPSLGGLYGRYLYGDWSTGQLRSLLLGAAYPALTDRPEGLVVDGLASFGEDSCGRLSAVSAGGLVARLVDGAPNECGRVGAAQAVAPQPARIAIRALRRKVRRGKRAVITVWVSPCQGRRGQAVRLYRGARRLGTRRLDRACTARFRPRIRRRWNFRAWINPDDVYAGALSRKLRVRIDRRHRKVGRRHARAAPARPQ